MKMHVSGHLKFVICAAKHLLIESKTFNKRCQNVQPGLQLKYQHFRNAYFHSPFFLTSKSPTLHSNSFHHHCLVSKDIKSSAKMLYSTLSMLSLVVKAKILKCKQPRIPVFLLSLWCACFLFVHLLYLRAWNRVVVYTTPRGSVCFNHSNHGLVLYGLLTQRRIQA